MRDVVSTIPPTRRGVKPAPKVKCSSAFVTAIHESGLSICSVATRAGYPHTATLSSSFYRDIPATRQNLARLRKVAEIVNFTGDLFEAAR